MNILSSNVYGEHDRGPGYTIFRKKMREYKANYIFVSFSMDPQRLGIVPIDIRKALPGTGVVSWSIHYMYQCSLWDSPTQ